MRVRGRLTRRELASATVLLHEFSARVRKTAESLVDDSPSDIHQKDSPTSWEVVGRGSTYTVNWTPGVYISCSCPNGMKSSQPRCYHAAAILEIMSRIYERISNG